jgi:hypothetical protein
VSFIDTLPAGFTFASAPAANNGFTCVTGSSPNQVVCSTTAAIASVTSRIVEFTANVPSGLALNTAVLNQVQIDPANNGGDTTVPNCSTLNTSSLTAGTAAQSTDKMCAAFGSKITEVIDF